MKNLQSLLLKAFIIIFISLPISVNAAGVFSDWGVITQILVVDGSISIKPAVPINPGLCSKDWNYIYPNTLTDGSPNPEFDKFYSGLLAAFFSGKETRFVISNQLTDCRDDFPAITRFDVRL